MTTEFFMVVKLFFYLGTVFPWSEMIFLPTDPVLMSLKDGYHKPNQLVFKAPVKEKKSVVVNGIDLLENVPPRTENEVNTSVQAIHQAHHKKKKKHPTHLGWHF